MSVVDVYLAELPKREQAELERIRQIVKKYYPDAREAISYGMPAFKYQSKYLVAYWGFKDHLSLFPTAGPIEALREKLTNYGISKGTIQFTLAHPLPETLIVEILQHRVKTIIAELGRASD
ncbi:MAG: iron chaperone [Candidatus Saccharimonadales bacterium]